MNELGVKVPFHHSDRGFAGPLEDIWNIKSAKYIIASYGTFSWMGALLSEALEIHKPYTSNNWANYWAEEAALFVDDQPQYIYHNTEAGRYFLSAGEVLKEKGTAFVEGVLQRAGGAGRSAVALLPAIPADKASCEGRAGGEWTDACGGGAEGASRGTKGGSSAGAASVCKIHGAVVFRRPCGVCFEEGA